MALSPRLRTHIRRTIRGFVRNCNYYRSIMTTFTSLCNLSSRVTGHVNTNFNNKINEVEVVYKTISNVIILINLSYKRARKSSHRKGSTYCGIIRSLLTGSGRRGNDVVYTRVLNLGNRRGTRSDCITSTEATRCCGSHPYTTGIRDTTEVFTRCLVRGRGT